VSVESGRMYLLSSYGLRAIFVSDIVYIPRVILILYTIAFASFRFSSDYIACNRRMLST